MGRFFFIFLACFLTFTPPVFAAATIYRRVDVTATVTPSPEWMALVRSHSYTTSSRLPLVPYTLFTVSVSDGSHPLKNQQIQLTVSQGSSFLVQNHLTGSDGLAQIIIPDSYLENSRVLPVCKIMNHEIPLNNI
jgi:hypothetical protein